MDILNTIPKIGGVTYLSPSLTVSFGQGSNHLVIQFGNAGGGYYPIIIMDDQSEFSLNSDEFIALAKWADKACKELDKQGKKYEVTKED